jgi:biopolymer transport protein ExbB
MTTAAGLAVAMPASIIHAWLEARMEAERGLADQAIQTVLRPIGEPRHA